MKSIIIFKLKFQETYARHPVHNGLIKKVNTFCIGHAHLHTFHTFTKIMQIGWGHHVNFLCLKKSAITFIEGCTSHTWYKPLFRIMKHRAEFNTLRPRQNGRHFADEIFKYFFFYFQISMKNASKDPINLNPALIQIMAWRRWGWF